MSVAKGIVEALEILIEDDQVPNSVNLKLTKLLKELKSTDEMSLTLNKAISELEELSDDVNIPSFIRTQLWSILSQLAALEAQI